MLWTWVEWGVMETCKQVSEKGRGFETKRREERSGLTM